MHSLVNDRVTQHADRAGASAELVGSAEADHRATADPDQHPATRHKMRHVSRVGSAPLLILPVASATAAISGRLPGCAARTWIRAIAAHCPVAGRHPLAAFLEGGD